VYQSDNKEVGLCVRMIFGERLYAVCGKDAEKVINWSEQVSALKRNDPVPDFPIVGFQSVMESVKMVQGELIAG
jgi:hypothetical protein